MDFIIYFDIAALIAIIFLTLSVSVRRQFDGLSNKLYFLCLVVTFISTIFDILASIPIGNRNLLFFLNNVYLICRVCIVISFFLYSLSLVGQLHKLKTKNLILSFSLSIINITIILINMGTRFLFDYTEDLAYVRKSWMAIIYVICYIYGVSSVGLVLAFRKKYNKTKILAVLLAIILQSGASFIQLQFENLLVEMFATTISLFLLSIFVERPEEYLDFKTKLPNSNAFSTFVQSKIDRGKNLLTIIIHIKNITSLYNIYRYNEAILFLRDASLELKDGAKKIDKDARVYYIGQGSYAICFFNNENSEKLLNYANNYINNVIDNKGNIAFHFNADLCLVEYPLDYKDVDSLIGFSNSFYNILPSTNNIYDVSKHRNKEETNILFTLDKIIDEAILNESFEMHYQPIYSIKEGRFNSCEALVRLVDKTYGVIPPAQFVSYAEKTGKMAQIGNIILNKVFQFIAGERFETLGLDYIEINLSILQFLDINMVENINTLVDNYEIDKKHIWFELTESVAIAGDRVIEDNISKLNEEGYVLSLDDFGTGYSNIARLTRLPISIIKLDKSLVDRATDPHFNKILKNLVNLILSYGNEVLAEGVEDQETFDVIKSLNINYIQGFYFAKAMPLKEFIDFIVTNNKKNIK